MLRITDYVLRIFPLHLPRSKDTEVEGLLEEVSQRRFGF